MTATSLQFSHMNDADAFTSLKSEPIDFSLAGDNVVVSGVAGNRILVFRIFFVVDGDTEITFQSGVVTELSGPIALVANGSITLDISNVPWFQTDAGKDFIISSSQSVQVSGTVYYRHE